LENKLLSLTVTFKNPLKPYIIMIIPVRCFSCGKPIGHLWEEYKKRKEEGENEKQILDDLGLERFCCRSVFLGQADNLELISEFKKA
jgi:DNA-directed RNA polymerase subunit N (RpoN/RPB10)